MNTDPAALSLLGNTYKAAGQFAEARKWFTRELELSQEPGLEKNFLARMAGAESLANLGELDWEQGNHSGSLEYLEKAVKAMETAVSECDADEFRVLEEMSLASYTLSLAKKYFKLDRFVHASDWARRHLAYVPACSEAKVIACASFKFLPRTGAGDGRDICVLLELRQAVRRKPGQRGIDALNEFLDQEQHPLRTGPFFEAVLPYFARLSEAVLENYDTNIDDLKFAVDEDEKRLLVTANTKDKRRCGEIAKDTAHFFL